MSERFTAHVAHVWSVFHDFVARLGACPGWSALLLPLLCAWVAGTALQLAQPRLWPQWAYAALWLVTFLLVVLTLRHMRGGARLVAVTVLVVSLAWSLTGLRAAVFAAQALHPALYGRDVVVRAVIDSLPQATTSGGLRWTARIEHAYILHSAGDAALRQTLGDAVVHSAAEVFADGVEADALFVRLPPRVAVHATTQGPRAIAGLEGLRAGQRWQWTLRLRPPHGPRNPHGFDTSLWRWTQGVQATAQVRSLPAPRHLGQTMTALVQQWRQRVRDAIVQRVTPALSQPDVVTHGSPEELLPSLLSARSDVAVFHDYGPPAAVVAALVTGDQAAMTYRQWQLFRDTGVVHLVSISGLHITMFAWMAVGVVGWLWRRSQRLCQWCPAPVAAGWAGLMLAGLYALFSGWGIPAQRTLGMLAVVLGIRALGLYWHWSRVWLLVLAAVVAWQPWALLQPGFWLSFVAVGVLFATTPLAQTGADAHGPITRSQRRRALSPVEQVARALSRGGLALARRVLVSGADLLRTQVLVSLALLPLMVALFAQVSVVGLVANLWAVPWVTLVLTPLSMLGVIAAPLWDGAAWCAAIMMAALNHMAQWSLAVARFAQPPWWAVVLAMAGCLWMVRPGLAGHRTAIEPLQRMGAGASTAAWPSPRGRQAMRLASVQPDQRPALHTFGRRLLGLPLVLPLLLWTPPRPAPGKFDLWALDVGQGSAVVVRTARHSLLFDAGPRYGGAAVTLGHDAGAHLINPALQSLGVALDMVILSHDDIDHTGGALSVLAAHPRAKLIGSGVQALAQKAQRPLQSCLHGQSWQWDGVLLDFLHPTAGDLASVAALGSRQASRRDNGISCVLRIRAADGSTALLTGDIERREEGRILQRGADVRAQLLVAPHHGSAGASSQEWVRAVRAQVVVFQSGLGNSFGHPAETVTRRYAQEGGLLRNTATCGAVYWRSDQPHKAPCERLNHPRYWDPVPPAWRPQRSRQGGTARTGGTIQKADNPP